MAGNILWIIHTIIPSLNKQTPETMVDVGVLEDLGGSKVLVIPGL